MLTTIPNQPVTFDTEENACKSLDFLYTQPVEVGDITKFQVNIDPCLAIPVNNDPEFLDSGAWVLGLGWTIINGEACRVGIGVSSITQDNVFHVGSYYRITIDVNSIDVSDGVINIGDGANTFGSITEDGELVFYGFPTSETLRITGIASGSICMESLNVVEIPTNLIVGVSDLGGNIVEYLTPQANPEAFDFVDNWLTVCIDWDSFATLDQCYFICLTDPCCNTNGQNGLFNGNFDFGTRGWDLVPSSILVTFQIQDKEISYTSLGIGNGVATNDVTDFLPGLSYDVTYTVVSVTTASMQVKIGTVTGALRTTVGTFTDTILADGTDFAITMSSLVGGGSMVVDNISIALTNQDDLTCDLTSNNFKFSSEGCALEVTGCSNTNSLGFNFTNFTPSIRLNAKLVKAQYPTKERNTITGNDGKKRLAFYDGRKTKELRIGAHPEYVHDFLRTLLGYDKVFIDQLEYIVTDDEYEVNYEEDAEDFGTATLIIELKQQLTRFVQCAEEDPITCLAGELVLGQQEDQDELIVTETGRPILIRL